MNFEKSGIKKWLIIVAVLITSVALIWWFFFREQKQEISYFTTSPKISDLTVTVQATGNLEPLRSITVGIEVSGTLEKVLVDYNDRVKKGQILARLDTTKLESTLESIKGSQKASEANLKVQEVAVREAKLQLDRTSEIFAQTDGAYPSQKEMDAVRASYDKAVASLEASKAHLDQIKAEVKTAEENLKKAVVLSPIDGIVLDRQVDEGQTVVATMQTPTLFVLAESLEKMQVVVAVDEADVGDVREGQKVIFNVNTYPEIDFEGVVTQVRLGSEIVSGVVTYNTVVEVENKKGLLRPGMTASASIITKLTKDALVVPNAAFRFAPPTDKQGGFMRMPGSFGIQKKHDADELWILENGEIRAVKVKRGETDGTMTAVISSEITAKSQIATGIRTK